MRAALVLGAIVLAGAGGCASPLHAWQKSLERYVKKEGNGDLNVLRQPEGSPAEGDFSMLGARRGGFPFFAPTRTDAHGELLGRREILGEDWFIYLLGMVEYRGTLADWPVNDPRLTDVRLVAVTARGMKLQWRAALPDPAALEQYTRPQLDAWRRSDPSRAQAPEGPTRFPTPADRLVLSVEGDAITASDGHSGARWRLEIEPPEGTDGAARRPE
jgi:hypothetical protein